MDTDKHFNIEPHLLRVCAPAMSNEESRYYLKGVHIFERDGKVIYEATNGHFLIRVTSDMEQGEECKGLDIILSDFMVNTLDASKFLKGFGAIGVDYVPAIVEAQTIHVEMPDGIATNKLVEGTFPQTDHIIPRHRRGVKDCPILALNMEYFSKIAKSAKDFHSNNVEIAISENIGPVYFYQRGDQATWEAVLMPVRKD